ncbi:hypothetical protein [Actinopolyspora saharensis]|uniref:hypothetical protein n=1 Tax=Actinopolyspora saharensis TaxID=995062 RepID=UPI003F6702F0
MSDDLFRREFREALIEAKCARMYSPEDLIEMWDDFVGYCEYGYLENIEEYNNDRSTRDLIEDVLNSEKISQGKEIADFSKKVEKIDERFGSILASESIRPDGPPYWWKCFPPKYAGPELVDCVRKYFGVEIEVVYRE